MRIRTTQSQTAVNIENTTGVVTLHYLLTEVEKNNSAINNTMSKNEVQDMSEDEDVMEVEEIPISLDQPRDLSRGIVKPKRKAKSTIDPAIGDKQKITSKQNAERARELRKQKKLQEMDAQ